jgi:hypothetical protein
MEFMEILGHAVLKVERVIKEFKILDTSYLVLSIINV